MPKSLFLTALQVSQEAQRSANELRDFRDRVLPRLTEANAHHGNSGTQSVPGGSRRYLP
jgi:hypothetical protein